MSELDITRQVSQFIKRIADGKVKYTGQWDSCGQAYDYWEFDVDGVRHSISLEQVPEEYQLKLSCKELKNET